MSATKTQSNFTITTDRERPDGTILFRVKGAGEFTFDPAKASEANRARALRHGFVQRLSDAAAKSRDTKTFQPASPASKLAAMQVLATHYESGAEGWSPEREASTGPGLDVMALEAVAKATGKAEAEVRAMVAEGAGRKAITPRVYLAALCTADKVKPILARMQAAGAAFDADAELDEATKG